MADADMNICANLFYICTMIQFSLFHYRAIAKTSFVDYIKGGCELNLIVAIDFTVRSTDTSIVYCTVGKLVGKSYETIQIIITAFWLELVS